MPKAPWNKVLISKSLLRNLYIAERLSISLIANKLNVSGKAVHNRLREYRIPTRSISVAKRNLGITKAELKELYLVKKLSMSAIAKLYGCTHATIVNYFKYFNLHSRGHLGLRKPISTSESQLRDLYETKKFYLDDIAKKLNCSRRGLIKRMHKYSIKLRGNAVRKHWRYKKKSFDGILEEKAYMIGFRLGDLNVKNTNQVVVVRGSTTIPAQVKLIESLFSKYGGVSTTIAKRGTYEQNIFLDRSFDFLLPKHDRIEEWIYNCPRCSLAFIAGYTDAEGHICVRKYKNGCTASGFEIQTYDKNIIRQIWEVLNKLNINSPRPSISKPAGYISSNGVKHNGDTWRISIYSKEAVWKLTNYMEHSMRHGNKTPVLKKIKRNILDRNQKRRGGKVISLSIPKLPDHLHATHTGH